MDIFSSKAFEKDIDYVNFVNVLLNEFRNEHLQNHVPLGPDYKFLDHELSTEALQLHRLVKKFEFPDDSTLEGRAKASIEAMLSRDESGLTRFNPGNDRTLTDSVRHTLYNARNILHEAIAHYRFSVSDLELTSGETHVSARGNTSVYAKLSDPEQWCVTTHAKGRAYQLIYNSPLLRTAAKRLYKKWFDRIAERALDLYFVRNPDSPLAFHEAYSQMWEDYHDTIWKRISGKHPNASRNQLKWLTFSSKLDKIVTVVTGSRLTTVPKDNADDRVILCEPWLNMLVERTIAIGIRKVIKKHFHIDLQRSQNLHGLMISDLDNVTIDWRNASNSNYWAQVSWFLKGTPLWKDIDCARNRLVVTSEHEWRRLNMVSPNGNGFTFELMTLMLLTVGRTLDSFCHVYGDDVIIDRDVSAVYISTIEYMGYELNASKTFLDGNFRESCGSFYNEGYIISYDLHYAEDIVDAIIVTNKVGIMAHATETKLRDLWLKMHHNMLAHCPRNLLRGFLLWDLIKDPKAVSVHIPDLADGILISSNVLTKLRQQDPLWLKRHEAFLIDHMDLICDLNARPSRTHCYRYVTKRSISYADTDDTWLCRDNVGIIRSWFYIWSGRCIAPTVRETRLFSQYRIAIM